MKRLVLLFSIAILGMQNIQAQGIRTYTTSAEDSMTCVTALSLYIEFYKQGAFKDAKIGWKQAATVCPKSTESLWQNGQKMYTKLAKEAEDVTAKEALLDTLFWIYDQRIANFGKEGYVLGLKGADMAKYRKSDPKAAHEVLAKAFELEGNKSGPGALLYLYKTAYDMYKKKLAEKELLFDLYSKVSDAVDYNLKNRDEKYHKAYKSAQANIDKMFSTVAECPDLIEIYQPKFEAAPDDVELLKKIIKVFDKRDCSEEDLYLKVAESLYAAEPSPEAAYAIANGYAKKKNLSVAFEYYTKCSETAGNDELKLKSLQKGAKVALGQGQYAKAKSYALKMLQVNPNSGEAYIIIGDAYVAGKKSCGGNECTGRAVYWAAVDKYYRAKSVDASVAEAAQKKINSYSAQFPKKEDCFFHGVTEGSSYTLDCWIGETTTVRVRD